ncbi:Ras- protein rsr1 [Apiotrichum porosum]|uniref:Ras-protein rsr1 n=1 Tax=Apiotrichum porosum TaxID=105984 RepID=A0A427XZW4_9TREE|nr:Ras- protein rsr1 [Apiotrichum porosum]RSH84350.1 Ras- protein rsr1 [Apiotrichum porosum]
MRVLRVAVMGAGGVGKSAITIRFINGHYTEMYDPTNRKQFEVDGSACLIEILDTAGIDQYLTMTDLFIRDNDGFVLVFSLTQQDSLEELKRTRQSIRRIKSINGEHVPLVLVGSKCDLEDEREVDTATGEKLAAEWHCQYLETSARENINIIQVFESIVRQLRVHGTLGRKASRNDRLRRETTRGAHSIRGRDGDDKKCVIM